MRMRTKTVEMKMKTTEMEKGGRPKNDGTYLFHGVDCGPGGP